MIYDKAKHTPLPWHFYNHMAGEYQEIFGPHGPHHDDRLPIIGKANAEFIVRACNCYDDLLVACKALAEIFPETDMSEMDAADFKDRAGETFDCAQHAKAAIAKAKGNGFSDDTKR